MQETWIKERLKKWQNKWKEKSPLEYAASRVLNEIALLIRGFRKFFTEIPKEKGIQMIWLIAVIAWLIIGAFILGNMLGWL
jgi:hypothetical protein